MSKKTRNKIRPTAFLRNFTKNVEHRNVVIESGHALDGRYQEVVDAINIRANTIIQELNSIIYNRQVPYVTLTAITKSVTSESRAFLLESDTPLDFAKDFVAHVHHKEITLSHLVDLLIAPGSRDIDESTYSKEILAEIIINQRFFECAMVDILLDIAMFNSYSFLKKMSLEDKQKFSFAKCNYFKSRDLSCFYKYKSDKELYYSFAFSARCSESKLDVSCYEQLWDDFIKITYPSLVHKELSIPEQLKLHVDYGQLPKTLNRKFSKYGKGAYLILRTNTHRTLNVQPFIGAVFGIKDFEVGKIEIASIDKIYEYKAMFENLDVSAFKIVNT